MKKTLAAILSLTLALTVLAGCSDSDSSTKTSNSTASQSADASKAGGDNSENAAPGTISEPDFLGFLTGVSDTDYYNMSFEDFNSKLGVALSMNNCTVFTNDGEGYVYAKYPIGKTDSILAGRVKLAKEYNVFFSVTFDKNKLKKMTVNVEGLDSAEEADVILEDFLKALEGKLPEGYEKFKPVEHGKSREVGYTKTRADFCVTMKRDEALDGSYHAVFAIENYAERYKMK